MKAQHNKILTLIDIEEPIQTIIKSTINIAKTFDADVKFLYVKKAADLTRTENQLAVMRTMAEEQKAIETFKKVLQRMQRRNQVRLDYVISEGPIKKTIPSEIRSYQPDLVVLGKRKPSVYRLIGKQVTELVLKNFDRPVLITHPTEVLEIKESLSLGVLNDLKSIKDNDLTNALIGHSKEPIKLFSITDGSEPTKSSELENSRTISYSFENNQNAINNLTSYVHRNNVNLLFLGRVDNEKPDNNVKVKDVLKRVNTSMLMVGSD